ncbi:ATP-dependent DNA ligase [Streptomyces sp. NPDC127020]|uniref:ATP-dependent DNA ligase n=1 Tax=Streptomyces sp. NPDC127020 TaxID=3347109 RepID=UPI00364AF238
MAAHINGELVVWEDGRLAFERLQQRLARRRGAGALAAAQTRPARLVVFDLLRLEGADLTPRPYQERRVMLEDVSRIGVCPRRSRCVRRPLIRLPLAAGWSGRRPASKASASRG